MSKQRPSNTIDQGQATVETQDHKFWEKRIFHNTYTRAGRQLKLEGWSVKIQHLGRRHTFALGTADRALAALEAKALYETLVTEGWESALNQVKNEGGFSKSDPRYWRDKLLVRRYRFPASIEPEKALTAWISHAGSGYFFPLGTDQAEAGAKHASQIYCAIVKAGWQPALNLFPRELIVAFEWSANPIMWTYTTVHTLVGRLSKIDPAPPATPVDGRRVLIVETDTGLRRALTWSINHQAGFTAVPLESPEGFVQAAATHRPALVLLNRSLAERIGIEFSGGLTRLKSGALALAYSVSVDGDHMFVATPGGAEGYMLKRVNPSSLLELFPFSAGPAGTTEDDPLTPIRQFFKALLRPRTGQHTLALAKLTPRENEVLMLLSKGCVDKEIATAMGISVWTVHGHIKKIFERLGVRTRTEAVVRYLEK